MRDWSLPKDGAMDDRIALMVGHFGIRAMQAAGEQIHIAVEDGVPVGFRCVSRASADSLEEMRRFVDDVPAGWLGSTLGRVATELTVVNHFPSLLPLLTARLAEIDRG